MAGLGQAAMGASLLKLDDVKEARGGTTEKGHVPLWGQCLMEANYLIHSLALGKVPPSPANETALTTDWTLEPILCPCVQGATKHVYVWEWKNNPTWTL